MVSGPDESAGDSFIFPLPFQLNSCVPEEWLLWELPLFHPGREQNQSE